MRNGQFIPNELYNKVLQVNVDDDKIYLSIANLTEQHRKLYSVKLKNIRKLKVLIIKILENQYQSVYQ